MSKKSVFWVLIMALALISALPPQLARAGSSDRGPDGRRYRHVEATGVEFAVRSAAETGRRHLRIVVSLSGPARFSAAAAEGEATRLTLDLKKTDVKKVAGERALDGKIASRVAFSRLNRSDGRMTIQLPWRAKPDAYKIFTLPEDKNNKLPFRIVIDVNDPEDAPPLLSAGLEGKVIVVDPGHGGSDSGAIGPHGIMEKNVTLAVALQVKDLLEKAGARVALTRRTDTDVYGANATDRQELAARVAVGRANRADLFLSIHADSFVNERANGTTTYYYAGKSHDRLLADSIESALTRRTGLLSRGARSANFYVVKNSLMPAALVEMAFISNPREEALLNSPSFQRKTAVGIVEGLERFFARATGKEGGP